MGGYVGKNRGVLRESWGVFLKRPTFLRFARSSGRLIASLYRKLGLLHCFCLAAMEHIRRVFVPTAFDEKHK